MSFLKFAFIYFDTNLFQLKFKTQKKYGEHKNNLTFFSFVNTISTVSIQNKVCYKIDFMKNLK